MNDKYQNNAILIQRNLRGFIVRNKFKSERLNKIIAESSLDEGQLKALESMILDKKEHISNVERRIHPKTHMDFKLIHDEFDKWKELQKANLKHSPCDQSNRTKIATEQDMKKRKELEINQLNEEIKILREIDHLKVGYLQDRKDKRKVKTLNKMSRPVYWKSKRSDDASFFNNTIDNELIEVITPNVALNRHLVKLYKKLCSDEVMGGDRLKLLKKIKDTLLKNNANSGHYLIKDIINLINQEIDLSTHCDSLTAKALVGLRMRLKNLFYKFLEQHSDILVSQHKCQEKNDAQIMIAGPIFKVKPVNLQRCEYIT